MRLFTHLWKSCALVFGVVLVCPVVARGADTKEEWLSPAALEHSADGRQLFVAAAEAGKVLVIDAGSYKVQRSIKMPESPTGLAIARDGKFLYVTCASPHSRLVVVDAAKAQVLRSIPLGHTALGPVLSPDGTRLYVCNRFENTVSVVDLEKGKETGRIAVEREPVAAALTPDGKYLLVANHLPAGRANAEVVAATVSVIDVATGQVVKRLQLPNGSGLLRDVRISPNGRYACVTHGLARFHLPTTQLERGWMNTNALTLIDLEDMKIINTVLLDNVDSGAANPWAAAWSADGKTILVTHAGTHELSVIDFPGLLRKLAKLPEKLEPNTAVDVYAASHVQADVPNDLSFLVDLRQRVKLNGKGPRSLAVRERQVIVAHYFSDSLDLINLDSQPLAPREIKLGSAAPMGILRRGELLFNDASICFQGWQSCASCHSEQGRSDGLNWDLLNDGIGNPKNSKSLLLSHRTPPAMSMGVRETAETAVRAGIRHILFTVQPEEVALALDEWLKSLKPLPSPGLVDGKLSPAAKRGQKLFNGAETGCATCHKTELFTDLKHHNVGTLGERDRPGDLFDTPTLIELWRTSPYLHDGSAANLREVLTDHNKADGHGRTAQLTAPQINDLVAYLLSL